MTFLILTSQEAKTDIGAEFWFEALRIFWALADGSSREQKTIGAVYSGKRWEGSVLSSSICSSKQKPRDWSVRGRGGTIQKVAIIEA